MKIFLLELLVLVGCVGCRTSNNPEFCCTSESDCASFEVPEIRSCGSGLTCVDHRCVRAKCSVDLDCSPEQPVCSDGFCVQCDETHACSTREPVCDISTNTCGVCNDHADCESRPATPYCNGSGCVQCVSSTQCGTATPYCDGGACRACKLDAECETHACGLDGTCVPEDQIAWMSITGNDVGTCTRAAPCRNFVRAEAVLNGRLHLVLEPGVYGAVHSLFTEDLFIHGNGATVIHAMTTSTNATLQLGRRMIVRDITMSATGPGGAAMIVSGEGVVLDSVTFAGNAKKLFIVSSSPTGKASVIARNLRVTNSSDSPAILVASTGDLTIDGGEISGGAIGIQGDAGAKVHLTNVLIWGTSQRALELAQATGEVEFSTIVDTGSATPSAPCAVSCNPNLRITSSIIWQQSCASGPGDAAGACTFQSSIVANAPVPGIANVDPKFVNPLARDYHLQPSSPARDAVDSGPATDFEGDPRPRGARFDIGADEAAP